MVKKNTISFREATTPIVEHVTEFGGQPIWLTEPQWPLSRSTGRLHFCKGQCIQKAAIGS